MFRCPSCARAMIDAECLRCRVPGVHEPGGWGAEVPFTAAVVIAALPLVFPLLMILCWPILSFLLARSFYRHAAARQPDLFLRILLGTLLAVVAGVGAFLILFLTCAGGFALWSGVGSLFR